MDAYKAVSTLDFLDPMAVDQQYCLFQLKNGKAKEYETVPTQLSSSKSSLHKSNYVSIEPKPQPLLLIKLKLNSLIFRLFSYIWLVKVLSR